ncbi:terminase small subunit [Weissella koreensis]|uniref:terminase small subunit n=1 Tax=Weissella koreensis TaxID=165096 RepID=UPI000CF32F4A|nr:terminase small subunit [Weissella koreensis]AVH74724.1 terminase [Weissella koreensis]QGN19946.1 terminase [Weissella koreensis]
MTEKWEEAEQDYLAGMKYKDIATKYEVTLNTVKSWKQRYEWSRSGAPPRKKSVHTKQKSMHTKSNVDDVIDDLDEYGLTDKQNVFVVRYLKSFNATQAYMDVYGVDAESARRQGSRLLTNVDIQSAIKRIKVARLKDVAVDEDDLIAQLAKQAFADVGNYVNFGGHDEMELNESGTPRLDTNDNPIIRHKSYVQLKADNNVDTTLIKKITVGKDGPIVELFDKTKAQERLLEEIRAMDRPNENNDSSLINAIGKAAEGAFDEDETET